MADGYRLAFRLDGDGVGVNTLLASKVGRLAFGFIVEVAGILYGDFIPCFGRVLAIAPSDDLFFDAHCSE